MGGRFFLKTLGPPELIGADGRPLRFKVRKHLALLIYLAVDHRTMHTREALVELLWGGVDLSRGRHSLSVALSVLRSVLGAEGLKATNSQVRLARAAIALDLDLLERGAILGGDGAPDLEVDRFLPDWEIGDAPGFQHWRDRKSTEYLPVLQAAFLTLADQARRSGDVRRMLSCAARLLALDPLSEEGIRTRMQGLAMQGDRISALRSYEEWREELEHQLGAAPSESLAGLAARLRRPTMAPAFERECFTPRPDPWADRRFVGRAAEYRELVNAWESTLQFDTRHILLTGESGIGKSTLAMRFGSSVALEGAAVARIQCFELEQRIPFGMIGALIATLLESPGAVATAPESLAEIGRVVPRVAERFPSLPPPRRAEGETARIHFAEGTFALFDSIMDEQPLLLIVDDYPRSDEASLSVLHMLLRRAGTDRLMVVLTARPPESGESTQIRRIREGLSYLPLRQIALSPLTEAESDSMLGALLEKSGKEAAAPIRRAIVDAGRGNPMALDLLSQDWVVHGEAALAISLPAMSHDMPASALEAVGYDRLIERMLPDLAPRTRTALQLAAILGPRLNDLDCFDIASLTPAQTLAAMTELV
ncbi:MAG TPA: AAA family ATPase, partial [Gemmatimonadales bacterium]|nr:AAA family ATPase [Gemmatimonadales bacterium]